MHFDHPYVLVLAVLAAAAAGWFFRLLDRRTSAQALTYSSVAFAARALRSPRWPIATLFSALVVGVFALGVALARPHLLTRVPVADGTVMLCLDTSGSMRAEDISPTRSEAVRAAARAFVAAVPHGTRVGIATFSYSAQVIVPPTADLDAVLGGIERIPQPDGATAMGDCLALAAQSLPPAGRRAIVLLTDGINNRGLDPLDVAKKVGQVGIGIETIGVGTNGSGEIIPGTNELASIDQDALREIAEDGHGRYVGATDAASLIADFEALAKATIWKEQRVDMSLPSALVGGGLLLGALLGGLGAGRLF